MMQNERLKAMNDEIADERASAIWAGVSAQLAETDRRVEARPARTRLVLGGGAFALTAVLVAVGVYWAPRVLSDRRLEDVRVARSALQLSKAEQGSVLSAPLASAEFELADGSRVGLARGAAMSVVQVDAAAVQLDLLLGAVDCDVARRPGRVFKVLSGDVEVTVIGTRFSVERTKVGDGARVAVKVQRGVVEVRVRSRGEVKRLLAGQEFQLLEDAVRNDSTISEPASPIEQPPDQDLSLLKDQPEKAVPREFEAGPTSSVSSSKEAARELFAKANELRSQGRSAEAVQLYEKLVREYPKDSRSGLAAFEMARLRMDALGDPSRAVQSLELALALSPGASFSEDALARLAKAQASLGRSLACQRAKEKYLRAFPNGVHSAQVTRLCVSRSGG